MRLKRAYFPVHKTLEASDLSVGRTPGTGKSHLAVALGRAAVENHRVRFFRADSLVEQLYRGLADNTVGKTIDGILRADLLVIDELGFSTFDGVAANHLFRLVTARLRDPQPGAHVKLGVRAVDQLPPRRHLGYRHPHRFLPPCEVVVLDASPTGYVKPRGVVARA